MSGHGRVCQGVTHIKDHRGSLERREVDAEERPREDHGGEETGKGTSFPFSPPITGKVLEFSHHLDGWQQSLGLLSQTCGWEILPLQLGLLPYSCVPAKVEPIKSSCLFVIQAYRTSSCFLPSFTSSSDYPQKMMHHVAVLDTGDTKVNEVEFTMETGGWALLLLLLSHRHVQLFVTLRTVARQASVAHHLLKFAQVQVHGISDAIRPSYPLTHSSPTLDLSQHQGLFQRVGFSHQMIKILEVQLQHQSFKRVFRVDLP